MKMRLFYGTSKMREFRLGRKCCNFHQWWGCPAFPPAPSAQQFFPFTSCKLTRVVQFGRVRAPEPYLSLGKHARTHASIACLYAVRPHCCMLTKIFCSCSGSCSCPFCCFSKDLFLAKSRSFRLHLPYVTACSRTQFQSNSFETPISLRKRV
jgi:hypothetical protein